MTSSQYAVSSTKLTDAERIFKKRGGLLRASEAIRLGIHPRTLYALRDTGRIEQLSRGVYRLSGLPALSEPDLVTVALRIPQGVICLISALSWHDLTTQIPHAVCVALPRGAEPPRIKHPPVQVFWFTGAAYNAGVQVHSIDHTDLQVYCAEKTIADCFKYRKKLGLDVAIEALRRYRARSKRTGLRDLVRYAKICRVEKVMAPYLETFFGST